jgi:hypothetical protein
MFVTQQRAASNEIAIFYKCGCWFRFELMSCALIKPREENIIHVMLLLQTSINTLEYQGPAQLCWRQVIVGEKTEDKK